ncbi:hypothetical protein WAK64_06755 [Bacillus spongiae]|uniref:DUF4203 domain-containing protein n=1 Tax=Bacillus spongiae TaxID=2683610 RepID=A0ABU8HBR0_9BACI
MDELIFLTGFLIILIAAIFAIITLVLSFKKDDPICCLGAGLALGVISAGIGLFVWGAIEEGGDIEDLISLISIIILILIALFLSIFTLLSVLKKKEFCCLGGGIAFAGVGLGAGIILSKIEDLFGDFEEISLLLLAILFLVILIAAFLIIVISLKKRQSLCCFAGTLALAGVGLGIGVLLSFEEEELIAGFGSLTNSVILLGIAAIIISFWKKNKQ